MEVAIVPLVLLANGLGAGVLLNTILGGFPYLRVLDSARYVHAHAFYSTRFDPFMPICIVLTLLGDAVAALAGAQPLTRVLQGVAALLALATIVVSVRKNVPVNRWIQSLDPERLPADFDQQDPRLPWGRWNEVRTWLFSAAFAVNCVAAATLL